MIESSVAHDGAKLTMSGPMVPLPPRPNVAVRINGVIDMSVDTVRRDTANSVSQKCLKAKFIIHTPGQF